VFDTSIVLFVNPSISGANVFFQPIQLFDVDGDGDLDIFQNNSFAYYGFPAYYFENTGTATVPSFSATTYSDVPGISSEGGAFLVDLDRDGDTDCFYNSTYGDFAFRADTSTAAGFQFGPIVSNPGGVSRITGYPNPSLADFDGDGDMDLLLGHRFVAANYFGSYDSSAVRYYPNTACDGRSLTIVTSDRNDPNQPNGVATVTVTGATLPFVTVLNSNMPVNRLTATFDVSGLAEGTYTLRLTDSLQCKVQGTFTINRNIVSVEQLKQASLVLMPNPTRGTLFIQAPSALSEVRVLTLDGRLVQQWFHLQTNQLELGDLPNGLYLLQARTQDGQMFTEKFSKQ
jgi:hypothetical protein